MIQLTQRRELLTARGEQCVPKAPPAISIPGTSGREPGLRLLLQPLSLGTATQHSGAFWITGGPRGHTQCRWDTGSQTLLHLEHTVLCCPEEVESQNALGRNSPLIS